MMGPLRIPNTNDGSDRQPYLRTDINLFSLAGLPQETKGPRISPLGMEKGGYQRLADAGFGGVQSQILLTPDRKRCAAAGLGRTAAAIATPHGLTQRAKRWKRRGYECATVLIGNGFESFEEALRLAESVLEASSRAGLPIYLETHRGTITQDISQTLRLIEDLPELRFNADFSHYVTGYAMPRDGGPEAIDRLAPIIERVRFIHGRISDTARIQVQPAHRAGTLPLFKELWTRCFEAFLQSASAGDYICFAPELLPPITGYASVEYKDGKAVERSDRFEDACFLREVAQECFEEAEFRFEERPEARTSVLPPTLTGFTVTPNDKGCVLRAGSEAGLMYALEDPVATASAWIRLQLGTGYETPDEAAALAKAILSLDDNRVLLETRRGTITQSIPKTVALAEQFPDLRFSLDVAEWFISGELMLDKLAQAKKVLAPIMERTKLIVARPATAEHQDAVIRTTAPWPKRFETSELLEHAAAQQCLRVWRQVLKVRKKRVQVVLEVDRLASPESPLRLFFKSRGVIVS